MGNACCNDANNKDVHAKNFKDNQPSKQDPSLKAVLEEAEKHPD